MFGGVQVTLPARSQLEDAKAPRDLVPGSIGIATAIAQLTGFMGTAAPKHRDATNVVPATGLGRDEAINRGLLVRISKLTLALAEQARANREDLLPSLGRMIFESCVNLCYLLRHGGYDEFVEHAFQSDIAALDEIARVAASGEHEWYHQQVAEATQRAFRIAKTTEHRIRERGKGPLFGLGLKKRTEAAGLEERSGPRAYHGSFGVPSHSVHGGWVSLQEFDLVYDDETYSVRRGWRPVRPERVLFPLGYIIEAVRRFGKEADYVGPFSWLLVGLHALSWDIHRYAVDRLFELRFYKPSD